MIKILGIYYIFEEHGSADPAMPPLSGTTISALLTPILPAKEVNTTMSLSDALALAFGSVGLTPDMLNSIEANVKVIDEAVTALFQINDQYVCIITHQIGEKM